MKTPIELAVIGAGHRARDAYGPYVREHPGEARIVAVAEPNPLRRKQFADSFHIPDAQCFESWQELLEQPQLAPALLNLTPDSLHVASTIAALERGYHVLLEKPMAQTVEDCVRLVGASERAQRILQICHVLRFTPFFRALHQVVTSGQLGQIISVEHRENIAYWHMAHSYVRGNWRNSSASSPLILAKCCHDLDILYWNHGTCKRLGSIGSLTHFRSENAPPGAPLRCTDGCPAADDCPFYAPRIYVGPDDAWPRSTISDIQTPEARLEALRAGPYGRCVYHCDNDVVDHQIVMMEMESGVSVALHFVGHSHREGRTIRIDGSRATLRGTFLRGEQHLSIYDHLTNAESDIALPEADDGHGGGDAGLMRAFLQALREEHADALTSARNSLESHLMAFAAEEARRQGIVVSMENYRSRVSPGG